jgi:hypothetical protein
MVPLALVLEASVVPRTELLEAIVKRGGSRDEMVWMDGGMSNYSVVRDESSGEGLLGVVQGKSGYAVGGGGSEAGGWKIRRQLFHGRGDRSMEGMHGLARIQGRRISVDAH